MTREPASCLLPDSEHVHEFFVTDLATGAELWHLFAPAAASAAIRQVHLGWPNAHGAQRTVVICHAYPHHPWVIHTHDEPAPT